MNYGTGPRPRRHLSQFGLAVVVWSIVAVAALALTILVVVPSRFGVSPG